MEKTSSLLRKSAESKAYEELMKRERDAFNSRFFDAAHHRYDKGSQTAQAMPLVVGLVPEQERAAVLKTLADDIRIHQNHVTAGDIGFHYVVDALLDAGRSDIILDMLERTDSPSYGYQLAQGATALTEAWDANPDSSQDHFMLGHAEEWFYRGLAGINLDMSRPHDERLVLRPAVVGDLQWVKAHYKSALGMIESGWRRDGRTITYTFNIPPGTSATVELSTTSPRTVTVNGLPIEKSGISPQTAGDRIRFAVKPGHYEVRAASSL